MKHFINISDLSMNELKSIIDNAKKRKSARGKKPNSQPDSDQPIQGKTMIMLFGKPSTRTRISFDLAVKQLGGSSIILNQNEIHYGKGDETIKDTAKVLSQYADIFMLRTDSHKDIHEFKNHLGDILTHIIETRDKELDGTIDADTYANTEPFAE